MRNRLPLWMLCCLAGMAAWVKAAQPAAPSALRPTLENYIASHQRAIVSELVDLVSLPNIGSDTENIQRNATWLRAMLRNRGFRAELLETGGNPLVYGELRVPDAKRTILWYAHYDGQPVDPRRWRQPSPFVPVLRDRRM